MMKHTLKMSLAVALLILAGCTGDDDSHDDSDHDHSSDASSDMDHGDMDHGDMDHGDMDHGDMAAMPVSFMGNANCPVTGKPVDHEVFVEHEGQTAYYCCDDCKEDAAADPAAAIAAAYPAATAVGNKICPISGDPVEDGNAVTWQGREIGLCCGMCEKGFKKDPANSVAAALAE